MALKAGTNGVKKNKLEDIEERIKTLEDLFTISEPSNGDILVYDSEDETFKNESNT